MLSTLAVQARSRRFSRSNAKSVFKNGARLCRRPAAAGETRRIAGEIPRGCGWSRRTQAALRHFSKDAPNFHERSSFNSDSARNQNSSSRPSGLPSRSQIVWARSAIRSRDGEDERCSVSTPRLTAACWVSIASPISSSDCRLSGRAFASSSYGAEDLFEPEGGVL
jgi:hypothetical protein